jgi:GT2 family glycosyltransferase
VKSISIVTVTWNCKYYLKEFLDSLEVLRANPTVEIIVVDNASDDGTAEFVRDCYPEVTLLSSKENLGFSRGNNLGISKSTGRYICLINPDVKVLDNCIEKMQIFMEAHPTIGLMGPKMLSADRMPSRSCMGAPTLWRMFCRALALDVLFPNSRFFGGFLMPYFDYHQIAEVDILNGWFWMTHRSALENVGLLDETYFMYADDLDWSKRFLDAGWKVVYFPEAESIHYGGGASINAPIRFSVEMQKANFQYWQKNYGAVSQTVYIAIVALHQIVRLVGHSFGFFLHRTHREDQWQKIKRSFACLRWTLRTTRMRPQQSVVPSETV